MRLVLDTNTAISGLLWGGTPGALIDAALIGRIEFASSTALLAELHGVLLREKFSRQLGLRGFLVADLFEGYAAILTRVIPATIPATILHDPSDDIVLATAIAAQADLIVSGDSDLLNLHRFQEIEIVSAITAVAIMQQRT